MNAYGQSTFTSLGLRVYALTFVLSTSLSVFSQVNEEPFRITPEPAASVKLFLRHFAPADSRPATQGHVVIILHGAKLPSGAAIMDPPFQPSVFAPGVISGPANDASPAFSPDGGTVYFSREGSILVSHRRRGRWSTPEIASFSGKWRDTEPAIAPDGSFLIFASSRPLAEGGAVLDGSWGGQIYKGRGGNLWRVQRQGTGWGEPTRLPDIINRGTAIFAPAVVNDHSLYFMEATMTTKFRIYRSQYEGGVYQEPEPLPFSGVAWSDVDPVVAPDESFMVFPSTRPPVVGTNHALFIVFREAGHWGEPRLLESDISGASSDEIEARLGPDHRTLYFSSDRKTPLVFPRTRETATRDDQRIREWDNGLLNIWQVDLSPWLEMKRTAKL